MIQCNIFCFIIIIINLINCNFIVILCYKTHSSSIINVMASVDAFVPACLSLALFLTRPILCHSAG